MLIKIWGLRPDLHDQFQGILDWFNERFLFDPDGGGRTGHQLPNFVFPAQDPPESGLGPIVVELAGLPLTGLMGKPSDRQALCDEIRDQLVDFALEHQPYCDGVEVICWPVNPGADGYRWTELDHYYDVRGDEVHGESGDPAEDDLLERRYWDTRGVSQDAPDEERLPLSVLGLSSETLQMLRQIPLQFVDELRGRQASELRQAGQDCLDELLQRTSGLGYRLEVDRYVQKTAIWPFPFSLQRDAGGRVALDARAEGELTVDERHRREKYQSRYSRLLREREQFVLMRLWGYDGPPAKTSELAALLGVTPERVREIAARAKAKLLGQRLPG